MALDKTQQAHRPGFFKQSNKEHKHGRHRSKGSISVSTKGKVSVKTASKKKNKQELNRDQRRHQALQLRQKKRDELLAKKRTLGGLDYAPFLVCVVPLAKNLDISTTIELLSQCDPQSIISKSSTGVTHICLPRFKQRFALVAPPTNNEFVILDTLKVCDSVLFLMSAGPGIDDEDLTMDKWGNNLLTSIFAQGLPSPVVAAINLESIAPKKRNECKQHMQKLIEKWLPDEKLMVLDSSADGINVLRKIGNKKRKSLLYRDRRPHIYAEHVEYVPDKQGSLGTLKLTGYLRGTPLSVNQLIHITGLGDFQMTEIDYAPDPNRMDKKKVTGNSLDSDDSINYRILEICDPTKQQSLISEHIPNPLDAEQTWPTEDEMEMAEKDQKLKKVKKIPKGWSDYQAAWIPDDDADFQKDGDSDNETDEEEVSENEYMDAISEDRSENSDDEKEFNDFATVTESEVAVNDDKYDQEMDIQAEKDALLKLKEAKNDLIFPDEIDTPLNETARNRFQKYRGLESFRTSPWDPKENLPSDYARIFNFKNYERSRKCIIKQLPHQDGALPGWYIVVHVKNVSQLLWSSFQKTNAPVILIGMFEHEQKMSVLNTVLKRTQCYQMPIKSKERLMFQCGYRRFYTNPIFSAHTNGSKHKFERYFQPNATSVATFIAPIQFTPAPVLCYKEVNGEFILVASGNLLSVSPDRLVIKRIVLSGHPFKIHKKSAVIRFMFFNREDIIYFKPCKLRTKMGRIGHIKEPLGTHGHMKCVFDGQLKSQDTVLLNLYKRVFPKWGYEELTVSCENNDAMET